MDSMAGLLATWEAVGIIIVLLLVVILVFVGVPAMIAAPYDSGLSLLRSSRAKEGGQSIRSPSRRGQSLARRRTARRPRGDAADG